MYIGTVLWSIGHTNAQEMSYNFSIATWEMDTTNIYSYVCILQTVFSVEIL